MDIVKYSIEDSEAFAPFVSTMEGTGAGMENSYVMFECDNSAARMLAESLAEFGIMSPAMEAEGDNVPKEPSAQGQRQQGQPEPAGRETPQGKKVAVQERKRGAGAGKGAVAEDPERKEAIDAISRKVETLGLDDDETRLVMRHASRYLDAEARKSGGLPGDAYMRVASSPATLGKLVFGVIQKTDPELFDRLKASGRISGKDGNAVSLTGKKKDEVADALSRIVGQVEVPDAFNVEIDDSEWDNALITDFGFPMINLTSTLVRDMLRSPDPSAQRRAYREFKKQLASDPDVAKALSIGMGMFGGGSKRGEARTDKSAKIGTPRAEMDSREDNVLVEGPVSAIADTFRNPVEILKSIAQNKGTPCRRNNLVVMYDEIAGKEGDSDELVKATPLGVSGGVLVDLNKTVPVPMSHLTAFYSIVDPKASFASYAKAMAEVNRKHDNAGKGIGGKLSSAGQKLLAKVSKGARKRIADERNTEIMRSMAELADYIDSNGHPPFYLLKPKSEPKEVDRWSDEDAAHGYKMITVNVDGHKAGMIVKEATANALFRVG